MMNMQKTISHPLLAAALIAPLALQLPACDGEEDPIDDESVLRSVYLHTVDSNDDQLLMQGEIAKPEIEAEPELKNICSQDIHLDWSTCLIEEDEFGAKSIATDLNLTQLCANFRTELNCIDHQLSQGDTACVSGTYCEVIIPASDVPMKCGWRITELLARNAGDGKELEQFDDDFIESLGFDLFSVVP